MSVVVQRGQVRLIVLKKCASTAIMAGFGEHRLIEADGIQRTLGKPGYEKIATFIRDPLSRIASLWKNQFRDLRTEQMFYPRFEKYGWRRDMDYEELIYAICKVPDAHADHHFRSQSAEISDHVTIGQHVFVGLLESLDDHWADFGNWSGLDLKPLQKVNVSAPDVPELSRLCRGMLYERYSQDFLLWMRTKNNLKKGVDRIA